MLKGKVVLVPFPFDDLSATKVRPAVCLTDRIGHHDHVILAFITSQPPPDAITSDLVIDPREPGFAATGLRVRSVLRLHRVVTVTAGLIRRELGQLSPSLLREVDRRLAIVFGIGPLS